jgi:hypothetical protein
MARKAFFVLIALTALTAGSDSQKKDEPHLAQRGEPLFVLKISEASLNINGASIHTCILVYPDESFRFEKRTRTTIGAVTRTTRVTSGRLTDDEAAQVKKIIHDPDIAMLDESSSKRPGYPFKKELHSVYAAIPRSNVHRQSIALVSADAEPLSSAATTLVTFLQAVEGRDLPNIPNMQPNDCQEPLSKKIIPN